MLNMMSARYTSHLYFGYPKFMYMAAFPLQKLCSGAYLYSELPWRLRQGGCKLQFSLGKLMRHCLKKIKIRKRVGNIA